MANLREQIERLVERVMNVGPTNRAPLELIVAAYDWFVANSAALLELEQDARKYRLLVNSDAVDVLWRTMNAGTVQEHYAVTFGFRTLKKYESIDAAIDEAMKNA